MRNILVVLILLAAIIPVQAGNLNISGRAGYYTPSGGTSSAMYGLSAAYDLNANFSVRAAVDTTTYSVNNVSTTFMPVTLDLIYNQDIAGMIHPYLGAGVSYNSVSVNGASTQTTGAQAEMGIKFEINGFTAGIEYRYMLADLGNANSGGSTFNGYMTGSFSQNINL